MKNFLVLLFSSLLFISCTKIDAFEKTNAIPVQQWFYDNRLSFTVEIKDTFSSYNIFIILRHTDAYNYNNIWLNFGSQAPGDTMAYQNINIDLASDAKGWQGTGMDDIWEVRKNITPGPVPFKKSGNYKFTISQIMRQNPLKHILNAGIRVERVNM